MSRIHGAVVIDTERCKGCNLCVVSCPLAVLELTPRTVNTMGYHYSRPAREEVCIGCANCATVCPDGCITVYRKKEE